MSIDTIKEKLGISSDRELSKLIGASHGACHHWRRNRKIPDWRMSQIRELAKSRGVKI